MHSLTATTTNTSYPILIGPNILQQCPQLQQTINEKNIFIISDQNVWPLVSKQIQELCPNKALEHYCIPPGETSKNLNTIEAIANHMISKGFGRDTLIMAVGGGVVTDLAGFLASIYQRGIPYISIPTTYLAQVDAAIGGKTAVNLAAGKNLLGSFNPPILAVIDTQLLQSLPLRELRAGLAEVIKIAMIADAPLWDWLQNHWSALLAKDQSALTHSVYQSCGIKQKIVAQDYRDNGQRLLLNFGHTVGHVLEALGGYQELLHGEAVALGMLIELDYGVQQGLLASSVAEQLSTMLRQTALLDRKLRSKQSFDQIQTLLLADKKKLAGQLVLAIPTSIGQGKVVEVDAQILMACFLERLASILFESV